jgi:hypothetical protein
MTTTLQKKEHAYVSKGEASDRVRVRVVTVENKEAAKYRKLRMVP